MNAVDLLVFAMLAAFWFWWAGRNWSTFSSLSLPMVHVLWLYHVLFTLFYFWYTHHYSSDAWEYYHDPSFRGNAETWGDLAGPGIRFVFFIVYPLSQFLQLSYLSVFFLFSAAGWLGMVYMLRLWEEYFPGWFWQTNQRKKWGMTAIFFWPSLHFWTVAIGKDSLAFLGIALFFWAFRRWEKRGVGLLAALLLMAMIRPHMAALLLGSALVGYWAQALVSRSWSRRHSFLLLVALLSLPLLLWLLLPQVDVFSFSISSVKESLEAMQHRFANTNHGLDLRVLSIPERYFTFLFRPMPGDSTHILGYGLMAQNILLLVLSLWALVKVFPSRLRPASSFSWALMIYFVAGTFIFSQALSNLGLIEREKMMFLLPWAYFLTCSLAYNFPKVDVSVSLGKFLNE
jgi:hypothetical protein